MVEAALASYMPRIQEAKERRIAELQYLKDHVRKEPEKVEQWFEREIEKTRNISSDALLDRVQNDAGE